MKRWPPRLAAVALVFTLGACAGANDVNPGPARDSGCGETGHCDGS